MTALYLGLMSGTSQNGVDAVVAEFEGRRLNRLVATHTVHYPTTLRQRLLALARDERSLTLREYCELDQAVARSFAQAARGALKKKKILARRITAIGSHGQTVFHSTTGSLRSSVQLGEPNLIKALTGITTVADFRRADMADGGQGAPLVPAFHHAVFAAPRQARAIVNVGGIANITSLPARGDVIGFDCGPGNVLLDGWIRRQRSLDYDADGAWAKEGKVLPDMLERLLGDAYFNRPPPKSTGRDLFNLEWLRPALNGDERPADVQATLLELTAAATTRAINTHCADATEIYLCGGGARNTALRERIAALLPGRRVAVTDQLGIAAEAVEAAAFAWLAARALAREPGNLPAVTGARGLRVLGAIYPA